jgi:di- and tripeptidase
VLSSAVAKRDGENRMLLTGGSDNCLRIWEVPPLAPTVVTNAHSFQGTRRRRMFHCRLLSVIRQAAKNLTWALLPPSPSARLFHILSEFVCFHTISNEEHREDCRQGAHFLRRTLAELGASSSLVNLHAPSRLPNLVCVVP